MRAMILAAGRGERLRPITDTIPKPLVQVGNDPLIVHHIRKLRSIGIQEIVINTAWLGVKLVEKIGDGSDFDVSIHWSHEIEGGLETAGGIRHALNMLGNDPFLVVNGDTYIDGNYSQFLNIEIENRAAHLWLVTNPSHHPMGDFSIENGIVKPIPRYTFSGAAIYNPKFFQDVPDSRYPLKPLLLSWMNNNLVSGQLLIGKWFDVGTIERLQEVNEYVNANLCNK